MSPEGIMRTVRKFEEMGKVPGWDKHPFRRATALNLSHLRQSSSLLRFGAQRSGRLVLLARPLSIAGAGQGQRQRFVRLKAVGVEGERLAILLDRLLHVAVILQDETLPVDRAGALGVVDQGDVELRFRLVEILVLDQRLPQADI